MAKVGNLQQGYVGKLEGQCFFKGADGSTQVRKITIPKNPKTLAQQVQRVIAKAVQANYKVMKNIADHSFEGKTMGFQCMNRFKELNMKHIRSRAIYLQEQGISLDEYYNFIALGSEAYRPTSVYVSEGTLNQVYAGINASFLAEVAVNANTYQGVIDALGARRGDQMTFVTVEKDSHGKYNFHYARVILDPRNANGAAALSVPFIVEGAIGNPNSRNNGTFGALAFESNTIQFKLSSGNVVAAGIIMSRRSGSDWFRSTCKLALSEAALGNDLLSLLSAAQISKQGAAVLDVENDAYLNNAGEGGAQGTSQAAPAPSNAPALSQEGKVNGVTQNINGGSTTVQSLTSFAFQGMNLSGATFKMTKNGGADVAPTSSSASEVSWTIDGAVATDVFRFFMDGTQKFMITVVANGGGGGNDGGEGGDAE